MPSSPSKASRVNNDQIPTTLPQHLGSCLNAQKRAILSSMKNYQSTLDLEDGDEEPPTNAMAYTQLQDLMNGTLTRGEGNSCLVLGPRGSGKTYLIERAISAASHKPIVIRLSGWVQHTDRLALREIARQLTHQTGKTLLQEADVDDKQDDLTNDDDGENPFLDAPTNISLPPTSHLPALISVIPTLSRPTVIILDAFDLFALHPRQSLLYCLLDTVQSCRVGQGSNGMLIIGVTTRIDTINLLEKRVKSRFSGRMLRTAQAGRFESWTKVTKSTLTAPCDYKNQEWNLIWPIAVNRFMEDRTVKETLSDVFSLTKDTTMLNQILIGVVLMLKPSSPFPLLAHLSVAVAVQQRRIRFPQLHALPYPCICLLIAAVHAETAGHDTFNFEMLHEAFQDQVKASAAAPIQIEGGSIGMVRCTRQVLRSGFEHLLATRIFVGVSAPAATVGQDFIRYRCVADREDVKKTVEKIGQTNLKKWFSKAQ